MLLLYCHHINHTHCSCSPRDNSPLNFQASQLHTCTPIPILNQVFLCRHGKCFPISQAAFPLYILHTSFPIFLTISHYKFEHLACVPDIHNKNLSLPLKTSFTRLFSPDLVLNISSTILF